MAHQTFPHAMPPLHILRDAVDTDSFRPLRQCIAQFSDGAARSASFGGTCLLSAPISDVLDARVLEAAVVAEWLRQSRIEFLVLSRPDDLTLDAMSREKAGISQHAVCFCISYGALDSECQRVKSAALPLGVCANLAKLFDHGGYLYFDENKNVVQINVFVPYAKDYPPSQVQTLLFGLPRRVSDTLRLKLESSGRLVSTTLPHIVEGGGTHYAWLAPGEHPYGPHGGFAYKLNRDHGFLNKLNDVDDHKGSSNWVYFAVHEA